MMIPPLIRIGQPPFPRDERSREEVVVLVERRGWMIVKWSSAFHSWIDVDKTIPDSHRVVHPSTIRCWMPQDGS